MKISNLSLRLAAVALSALCAAAFWPAPGRAYYFENSCPGVSALAGSTVLSLDDEGPMGTLSRAASVEDCDDSYYLIRFEGGYALVSRPAAPSGGGMAPECTADSTSLACKVLKKGKSLGSKLPDWRKKK